MVSKSPDSATVPSDGPVERAMAALIPCVDIRRGCGASGLKAVRISIWGVSNKRKTAHPAKYHNPIILEQVILSIPRATAQLHNHTITLPAMAQFARAYRCHSNNELSSFEGA